MNIIQFVTENITDILQWYSIGWLTTALISSFRAFRGKQGTPAGELDVIGYFFNWWFLLPIFLVRWTKYKLRGQNI